MELQHLQSKVVVIHSANDFWPQMTHAVNLAITDNWAPQGMLSYYDDNLGHMAMVDEPAALAKVYRKAFQEQVVLQ